MPACTVCAHPERDALEAGLVTDASLRGLARAHRVSASALRRHRDGGHLPEVKLDQAEEAKATRAEDLLKRAGDYERIAGAIVAGALPKEGRRDPKLALMAIDRALAAIAAQSRLLPGGKVGPAGEVRVTFNVPLPAKSPPPVVEEDDLPRLGDRSSNGR